MDVRKKAREDTSIAGVINYVFRAQGGTGDFLVNFITNPIQHLYIPLDTRHFKQGYFPRWSGAASSWLQYDVRVEWDDVPPKYQDIIGELYANSINIPAEAGRSGPVDGEVMRWLESLYDGVDVRGKVSTLGRELCGEVGR